MGNLKLNVGNKESEGIFKDYVQQKYTKLNFDKDFDNKFFDILSDGKIADIQDWVLSGKLKDLLDKNGSHLESKKGYVRVVDLHPSNNNETQKELQDKFEKTGKKVVERATIDGAYTTFCLNFHKGLEGLLSDYEDDTYLIRIMSITKLSDSLIYIIKKSETLDDIEVTVNRIPNSVLYGNRLVFVENNDVVGLKAFLTPID